MESTSEQIFLPYLTDEEEDIEVDGVADDPEETLVPEEDDYDAAEAEGEEEGEPAKKKQVVEE